LFRQDLETLLHSHRVANGNYARVDTMPGQSKHSFHKVLFRGIDRVSRSEVTSKFKLRVKDINPDDRVSAGDRSPLGGVQTYPAAPDYGNALPSSHVGCVHHCSESGRYRTADEGRKIAVLKTASNFQYFAPITSEVIRADTPGPTQSDIEGLPWPRVPRPLYPFDVAMQHRQ